MTGMRHVYATLIAVLAVMVLVFSLQNLENVTISFMSMSATLPLALLAILVYVAGMATGGFVLAVLRSWIDRARRT
jgi:lipopolysaccharide assembly protein A